MNNGNDGSSPGTQVCTTGTLPPDPDRKRKIAVRMLRDQTNLFRQTGHGPYGALLRAITRDPIAACNGISNWCFEISFFSRFTNARPRRSAFPWR